MADTSLCMLIAPLNANDVVGTQDIVWIVLDSLRFDVAQQALARGHTPFLQSLLPNEQWQKRQTMGSFTLPAHQAFFAGYLPVPVPKTADYQRLFACQFAGSSTTGERTWQTSEANIIAGLHAVGYYSLCIGGVGFFNKANALGCVLADYFRESHWSDSMGVTSKQSTERQVQLACQRLHALPPEQRLLLFINVSALHQPNCLFSDGVEQDSPETQIDALAYVDSQLPPLFAALQARGDSLCIICSDHGTAYGEDGYWGHGVSHPVVWDVPYAEFIWKQSR